MPATTLSVEEVGVYVDRRASNDDSCDAFTSSSTVVAQRFKEQHRGLVRSIKVRLAYEESCDAFTSLH